MPRIGPPKNPNDVENDEPDPKLVSRGERIKAIRELRGYTSLNSAMLATGAMSTGSYSQVELGKKDLFVSVAERLADGYGVSMDVLLGRAPLPAVVDEYPRRGAVIDSPEFRAAPPEVQDYFRTTTPGDAEEWSVVRWARELDELTVHFRRWGSLPAGDDSKPAVRRR